MAQFKDLTDSALQRLGERLIRNVQARVSQQVPSPGRNPFSKGGLSASLKYSFVKREDLTWELKIDQAEHGKFTNYGTREHYDRALQSQSIFGYEFRGYQRGRGGVRPQAWLSLSGDQPVYEAVVEAEVRLAWEEFTRNVTATIDKNKNIEL